MESVEEQDDLEQMTYKKCERSVCYMSFIAEKGSQPTIRSTNHPTSVTLLTLTCNGFSLSCCGVPTLPSVPE